jgi:hypothetical protein
LVSIRDDFGKERKLFVFDQRQIELKIAKKTLSLLIFLKSPNDRDPAITIIEIIK